MSDFVDHYMILQISPSALTKDIKSAYKRLCQQFHPDRHGGAEWAEEMMKRLNKAKDVLLDEESRRDFDEDRLSQLEPDPPPQPTAQSSGNGWKWAIGGLAALTLVGVGAGAWAYSKRNRWDRRAHRYRARNGQFRRARFW